MSGNLGPEVSGFLSDGAGDGGSLHFTLSVDDDAGVVFEVEDDTVLTAPRLTLANDDARHNLLAEVGVTLLDGAHGDITDSGSGETVEAATVAPGGDEVEVLSTSVVTAVDDGTDGKSKGDLELVTANRNFFTHVEWCVVVFLFLF